MKRDVLIVDDDAAVREALAQTLELNELRPRLAGFAWRAGFLLKGKVQKTYEKH